MTAISSTPAYKNEYMKKWYKAHPDKYQLTVLNTTRIHRQRRKQVFDILGGTRCRNPACRVPGGMDDYRCLQIDHINGGGRIDKRRFSNLYELYDYYIAHPEEAREKLQIYCANCNTIKRIEKKEN